MNDVTTKWVYNFGAGHNEGRSEMRNLLGGKGANLAEMATIGLPVPPGFTITTDLCTAFYKNGSRYPADLDAQVRDALTRVEDAVGLKFGDPEKPLLVSVRSGARVSMPGMMDTVLNLGLNDDTVQGLVAASGDERFAWDSYRRFIQMFGSVVLGVDHHRFEEIIEQAKIDSGVIEDTALTAAAVAGGRRGLSVAGPQRDRQALPAVPGRTAVERHRRCLRQLDEHARHHLSPAARHPLRMGHCRQRPGHGLRQPGQ